jgi:hypothetical protein
MFSCWRRLARIISLRWIGSRLRFEVAKLSDDTIAATKGCGCSL